MKVIGKQTIILMLLLNETLLTTCLMKFTNLKCTVIDPDFLVQQKCEIKFVARRMSVANIRFKLKAIITNIIVHFKVLKRSNGWLPFMNDITIDACAFLRHPNYYPIVAFAYNLALNYTNVRHACPYLSGEELFLDSMPPDENGILAKVPIDVGDYMLAGKFYVDKQLRLTINVSLVYNKDFRRRDH